MNGFHCDAFFAFMNVPLQLRLGCHRHSYATWNRYSILLGWKPFPTISVAVTGPILNGESFKEPNEPPVFDGRCGDAAVVSFASRLEITFSSSPSELPLQFESQHLPSLFQFYFSALGRKLFT